MTANGLVRIGCLRLTDAAPVHRRRREGAISPRKASMSASRSSPPGPISADKLTFGQLDAAVMSAAAGLAVTLRLRGVGTDLLVPMSAQLNGNSITVSTALADRLGPAAGPRKRSAARWRRWWGRARTAALAVVHVFSTHQSAPAILAGGERDRSRPGCRHFRDPPRRHGRCAAGRRNRRLLRRRAWGGSRAGPGPGSHHRSDSEIWPNHPEKCLGDQARLGPPPPGRGRPAGGGALALPGSANAPENADEIAAPSVARGLSSPSTPPSSALRFPRALLPDDARATSTARSSSPTPRNFPQAVPCRLVPGTDGALGPPGPSPTAPA